MSWKTELLGNLLIESRMPAIYPNPDKRIRVKLNVAGVEKRPLENEVEGATKQFIRKAGQFIYGKQNFHKGAFGIIPPELDGYETSADIPSFDVREDCLPEWIFYFFKINNKYIELEKIARGMGSKRIHPEQLASIKIPLPKIDDQKVYINKFREIETSTSGIDTENIYQFDLLNKIRQQILQDAVHGKLVQQDPNDEPASILLERIKAEKEKLVREKNIKREKPLPPIKQEDLPFEIPENWGWCRLGEILLHKPQNGYSPIESKKGKGIKCLTLTSTTSGTFKADYFKYVDVEISPDSFLWIKPNDILIQRGNSIEYVGIAAIYKGKINEFIYPDLMIKIRVFDWLSAEFIHQVLISPYLRKYFQSKAFGAQKSMPKINQEVVTHTLIPLPPLAEQRRILAKVEMLIKICDEMGYTIQQNQNYTQELLQVALKEALEPKPN